MLNTLICFVYMYDIHLYQMLLINLVINGRKPIKDFIRYDPKW